MKQVPNHNVQPTLPGMPEVSPRFRIDDHTRRVGLAGVAAAKALLAEQAARRAACEPGRAARKGAAVPSQRRAALPVSARARRQVAYSIPVVQIRVERLDGE